MICKLFIVVIIFMAFTSFNSFNSFIQIPAMTTENGGGGAVIAGIVTTLAGSTIGYQDSTGTSAKFYGPIGIAIDSTGTNLYVADTAFSKIRQIVISTGVVTTLAGSTNGFLDGYGTDAKFNGPTDIVINSTNTNLYVSDTYNNRIRQISLLSGYVTTLAGTGVSGYSDGGPTIAKFNYPTGITLDSTDTNLYVADTNNCKIRQIYFAGNYTNVDSIAGYINNAGTIFSGYVDGPGSSAQFRYPKGITIDSTNNNLYVSDTNNNIIRKIYIPTRTVSTFAGSGVSGNLNATGTFAQFSYPNGITIDSTDTNLYVADSNNNRIRKIVIFNGVVTTLAGSTQGNLDSTGTSAQFSNPQGITIDSTNTKLYVTDNNNYRIRKIT